MKIKDIKNPQFLKKMNTWELQELSKDIREFLIDSVSNTGGHLSSNLGVVELTIAIHKVFDSPKDKIIFDVSHQCYVHKILTGRAEKFDTLRQINGLSGFQKISESKYDVYEAGHSSTSLSAALGFAMARDMNEENYNVIAIIGDGSIGNGLCYEALNQIGSLKEKMIIVLNDNDMSISENVGALHNHLDKLRSAEGYENTKTTAKRIINKIPFLGKYIVVIIQKVKDSLKKLYLKEGFIFEELGIDYYGPINGHDFNELEKYFKRAKNAKGPVLIHVITEKGKGYKYAEEDKIGFWHGVEPFNKETGELLSVDKSKISWSEVICNSLNKQFKNNLVVITPAMETGSKLTKFREKHPHNFIDVGIAEEHALILANALSLEGKIPFISIYSSFLQRAYDEVVHDIARMNSHVILGIDRCGIVGSDGETHQGLFDITFLLPVPNIVLCSPKDADEADSLLKLAISHNGPIAIRYSKKKIDYPRNDIKDITFGTWEQITNGEDATLITYGDFVLESINIVNKLKEDGINIELVNARFLKPIDMNYFNKILNKNKPIFVYEESMKIGSLGSFLSTLTDKKINIFAIEDKFVMQGKREEILASLNLDNKSIYKSIKRTLTSKK